MDITQRPNRICNRKSEKAFAVSLNRTNEYRQMFPEANLLKNLAKTASAFPSEAIKYRVSRRRLGWSAVHPIAEAFEDECFRFAWLLRREAFIGFGYDPDAVFSENVDQYGFSE